MEILISDLDRTLIHRPGMDELYLEQVGRSRSGLQGALSLILG